MTSVNRTFKLSHENLEALQQWQQTHHSYPNLNRLVNIAVKEWVERQGLAGHNAFEQEENQLDEPTQTSD